MARIFYPIVDINDAIKEDKDNIYYKTWFTNKIDCMEEML